MKYPRPKIGNIAPRLAAHLCTVRERSTNRFHRTSARLFILAGLPLAVLALTAASPIDRRPTAITITPTLGNYSDTALLLSRDATIIPDAAPANATSMNVSTSTNFLGRLEAYPGSGVVRVTNAYPAGTYMVIVTAFDTGGARTSKTFMLTVTTPATCPPVTFTFAGNFGAGDSPVSMAVGDFNGDGKQDLVIANEDSNNVSILLGDGAGNFSGPTNFDVGDTPQCVVVGDFNGDGKPDLAVTHQDLNNVSILLGDGAGNFSALVPFGVGNRAYAVAIGDFNADGRQDLAVPNYGSDDVSILLGNGAGGFSSATNFDTGDGPHSVAVGDFDRDGKQDLAIGNYNVNTISILLGDGAGHFGVATDYPAGSFQHSVVVGNFNADGKQDLAIGNYDGSYVSILLGDGAGHFGTATDFFAGTAPQAVALGDFNIDGKQDLVAINDQSHNVAILLGDGVGSFGSPANFMVGDRPYPVAVGDFNGDSKQDLAVGRFYAGDVSILLANCATPTPTSVVSRKTHGGAGNFDINLPLTGGPGIECRTTGGTNDYAIVVTFSNTVAVDGNPQAQVTSGTGMVGNGGISNGGMVMVNGNVVTVPLTSVANAQTINVRLFSVNGGGNITMPMRLLIGDVNANGAANGTDVALTKARSGQPVDATNFRADVNASGSINASDVSLVKSRSGSAIP